eukprot:COSAG05_NODE_4802_length_1365_cov_0.864929_2_plen_97_part_01
MSPVPGNPPVSLKTGQLQTGSYYSCAYVIEIPYAVSTRNSYNPQPYMCGTTSSSAGTEDSSYSRHFRYLIYRYSRTVPVSCICVVVPVLEMFRTRVS